MQSKRLRNRRGWFKNLSHVKQEACTRHWGEKWSLGSEWDEERAQRVGCATPGLQPLGPPWRDHTRRAQENARGTEDVHATEPRPRTESPPGVKTRSSPTAFRADPRARAGARGRPRPPIFTQVIGCEPTRFLARRPPAIVGLASRRRAAPLLAARSRVPPAHPAATRARHDRRWKEGHKPGGSSQAADGRASEPS